MVDNRIQVFYLKNVGVLQILFHNTYNSKFVNLLHKCDDGKLTLKLIFNDYFFKFSIFISHSMIVDLKQTQITYNKEGMIKIRYYVTKELIKNKIFDYDNTQIIDCFIYDRINSINCNNCDGILLKNISYDKIVSYFNYDYIDNLEILSCHENDINNIIPNLDEKIKRLINFEKLYIQIPSITNDLNDFLYCLNCKLNVGHVQEIFHCSSKFKMLNFYLTLIKINDGIDIEKYLNHIFYYAFTQNLNIISFVCNDKYISFIINNNILYAADESINNDFYKDITIFNHFAIINYNFNQYENSLNIPILEYQYEKIIEMIINNKEAYKGVDENLDKYYFKLS